MHEGAGLLSCPWYHRPGRAESIVRLLRAVDSLRFTSMTASEPLRPDLEEGLSKAGDRSCQV